MDSLFPDTVKAILLGVFAVAFALNWLAPRYPEVQWLQAFRLPVPRLSEEQKARRRRMANRTAALEVVVAGLALPLLYVAATVMMFNDFRPIPTVIVGATSLGCIVVGIWLFARAR